MDGRRYPSYRLVMLTRAADDDCDTVSTRSTIKCFFYVNGKKESHLSAAVTDS